MRSSLRASNALRPASFILPAASRASTRATFRLLQILRFLRGVNRIIELSSSMPLRRPSIQPKQSASSTDSSQVMVGFPLAFL